MTSQDNEAHRRPEYEDEIDLFDLLKTLWKWRALVLGITAAGLLAAFAYTLIKPEKPVTHTAEAVVQIGKVADVLIESRGDILVYVRSDGFLAGLEDGPAIQTAFMDIQDDSTLALTISATSVDREAARQVVTTASERLIGRHGRLYRDAKAKLDEYRPKLEQLLEDSPRYLPLMWLDSYTYPTRQVSAVSSSRNPPEDNDTLGVAVTAIAALFLSIMLAFMTEAIRNRIREERERSSAPDPGST